MNKLKTVALTSLGCKVNAYDTEVLKEIFQENGFKIVETDEAADIFVINTCTVTHLGDRKSRQLLRRARRKNPNALIIATGCYAQVSPEEIEKIDEVDLVIGARDQTNIINIINNLDNQTKTIVSNYDKKESFRNFNIHDNLGHTRAYVKVQDGCRQFCSYCIVPYARGPVRSRSIEDTVKEVEQLVENGFKEVVLTGIHIASFGKDSDDQLIDLIKVVSEIPGIERVRLSSLEPTLITQEFLDGLSQIEEFCPHFHLSLQSGSNSVLKRMNRRYSTEQYKEIVDLIRDYYPDAGITTDIIVGFPGETEEEFKETEDFTNSVKFSKIHIFPYSPRSGTPAANFEKQVDSQIKQKRAKLLSESEQENRLNFYQQNLGQIAEVLFEKETGEGYYLGYSKNYIPVIVKSEKDISNQIWNVKLLELKDDKVIGKLIERKTNESR